MNSQIQTPGFTANKSLLELINHKLLHVDKFSDRILGAKIILKTDKSDKRQNKVCEVNLSVPGEELFAKKESYSFEEAFAQVIDALERQLLDWKSKTTSHKMKLNEIQDPDSSL
jgi:putative sigma-54 modulation protein